MRKAATHTAFWLGTCAFLISAQLQAATACQEETSPCERLVCLGAQGWYFDAMGLVARGEVWDCTSADAIYHLAKALAAQQRYEEALQQMERLFELHPDDGRYPSTLAQILHLQSTPPLPMVLSLPEGLNVQGNNMPGWVEGGQLVMLKESARGATQFPYRKNEPATLVIDPAYGQADEQRKNLAKVIERQCYSSLGPGLVLGDSLLFFTASHRDAYASAQNVDELQLHWVETYKKTPRLHTWSQHSKGYHTAFPTFDAVAERLIFSSNRPGGQGGMDLWYSQQNAAAASVPKLSAQKELVQFDDFQKMDIRTATILAAERVPKTDKLLKLHLDTGIDKRTVVSGIAAYYDPADLPGKRVTVLINLAPRKLRGIESQGMVLMAEGADGKLRFVQPEGDAPDGAEVR